MYSQFNEKFNNIFFSKTTIKHPLKKLKLKKGNIFFTQKKPFKYNYKNLIWFIILSTGCKPKQVVTKKRKNNDNEKTTLVGFNITLTPQQYIIQHYKLLNFILPNLEAYFTTHIFIQNNVVSINFFDCLSHDETELIESRKDSKIITKFNIHIKLVFNFKNSVVIKFFTEYHSFPIF